MFLTSLIMLAFSRHSLNSSTLPSSRFCKYSDIFPTTNKMIRHKYAAWKGEKQETRVVFSAIKRLIGICALSVPSAANHGLSKGRRRTRSDSRERIITFFLPKPKQPKVKPARKYTDRRRKPNLCLLGHEMVPEDSGKTYKDSSQSNWIMTAITSTA